MSNSKQHHPTGKLGAYAQHGTASHRRPWISYMAFPLSWLPPADTCLYSLWLSVHHGSEYDCDTLNVVIPCGYLWSTSINSKVGTEELTLLPTLRRCCLQKQKEGEIDQAMKFEVSSICLPQSHTGPPDVPWVVCCWWGSRQKVWELWSWIWSALRAPSCIQKQYMARPYMHTLKKRERYFSALVLHDGLRVGEAPKDGDQGSGTMDGWERKVWTRKVGKVGVMWQEEGVQGVFREPIKTREPSDSAGGSSRTELYLPKTVINVSQDWHAATDPLKHPNLV